MVGGGWGEASCVTWRRGVLTEPPPPLVETPHVPHWGSGPCGCGHPGGRGGPRKAGSLTGPPARAAWGAHLTASAALASCPAYKGRGSVVFVCLGRVMHF